MMDAVTGAFSYSGSAIATELVRRGRQVRTLTNHPVRKPAVLPAELAEVDARPLALGDPAGLREALKGVDTLYNTYWVRFAHGAVTFESAVTGSAALFAAAADAGVRRVVHVSITHADEASPFGYFRGKAQVERLLRDSGMSYAVVRPAILFGGQGVLINNIAWLMRRSPVVLYGGSGDYRIRGIHVDDLATLMADLGGDTTDQTIDAVGPESLSFRDLLEHVRAAVGARSRLLPVPGASFPGVTWALGHLLRDTLLTREEYHAMASGLADSAAPTTGEIRITDWIRANAAELGRHYAHELDRHFRAGPALRETDPVSSRVRERR
jgi:NADH dehydrogenase